ncbi:DUF1444 family protein [Fontivita pretiosa]|uniref:DUF1444 family protein n=1 Tax=Fontivita pretiosa TaxID=2989684 RepID=UPI003D184298
MAQPSREQFVQQVIEIVRGKFPAAKVARAEQPFSLKINGQVASLENLYRSALLQPAQMNQYIEQWMLEMVRASEGTPDLKASFEELSDRILPVILREDATDPNAEMMITQPLVAGLVVAYAVDSERSLWYIPRVAFQRWNISLDDLHEKAIENLVERSQAIAAHAAQDESGKINLILFQTMDGFDASRLLLPTLNSRLREHLGSPFAAGIPNRDILLCFRSDPQTVDRLRDQIAKDYRQMPHPITDRLLLVTPDGIAPLD